VRDIASGIVVFVLLAAGKPHILGRYLVAVHGTAAAVMLATAALLLSGPE
jgi:hypothetical protein